MTTYTEHGLPLAASLSGPMWWRRSEYPTADAAIEAQCDLECIPDVDLEWSDSGEWRVRLTWMRLADPGDYDREWWQWEETHRGDPRGVECWEIS